jgi:transcriptional regulator with XRE-family HTH domain
MAVTLRDAPAQYRNVMDLTSCRDLTSQGFPASNLRPDSFFDPLGLRNAEMALAHSLRRYPEVSGDEAVQPVKNSCVRHLGRFSLVRREVQVETPNMEESYGTSISKSRKFCVPREEKKARPPHAERIFLLRKQLGLKQEEFAARAQVDQTTVSNWETGKAKPGTHTYLQLARLAAPNVELQRELLKDSGTTDWNRRLREINQPAERLPSPAVGWDRELLEVVVEAFISRFKAENLSDRAIAQKIATYYELCHRMKTEDPAILERFLKSA